jgi:hypothetical protein
VFLESVPVTWSVAVSVGVTESALVAVTDSLLDGDGGLLDLLALDFVDVPIVCDIVAPSVISDVTVGTETLMVPEKPVADGFRETDRIIDTDEEKNMVPVADSVLLVVRIMDVVGVTDASRVADIRLPDDVWAVVGDPDGVADGVDTNCCVRVNFPFVKVKFNDEDHERDAASADGVCERSDMEKGSLVVSEVDGNVEKEPVGDTDVSWLGEGVTDNDVVLDADGVADIDVVASLLRDARVVDELNDAVALDAPVTVAEWECRVGSGVGVLIESVVVRDPVGGDDHDALLDVVRDMSLLLECDDDVSSLGDGDVELDLLWPRLAVPVKKLSVGEFEVVVDDVRETALDGLTDLDVVLEGSTLAVVVADWDKLRDGDAVALNITECVRDMDGSVVDDRDTVGVGGTRAVTDPPLSMVYVRLARSDVDDVTDGNGVAEGVPRLRLRDRVMLTLLLVLDRVAVLVACAAVDEICIVDVNVLDGVDAELGDAVGDLSVWVSDVSRLNDVVGVLDSDVVDVLASDMESTLRLSDEECGAGEEVLLMRSVPDTSLPSRGVRESVMDADTSVEWDLGVCVLECDIVSEYVPKVLDASDDALTEYVEVGVAINVDDDGTWFVEDPLVEDGVRVHEGDPVSVSSADTVGVEDREVDGDNVIDAETSLLLLELTEEECDCDASLADWDPVLDNDGVLDARVCSIVGESCEFDLDADLELESTPLAVIDCDHVPVRDPGDAVGSSVMVDEPRERVDDRDSDGVPVSVISVEREYLDDDRDAVREWVALADGTMEDNDGVVVGMGDMLPNVVVGEGEWPVGVADPPWEMDNENDDDIACVTDDDLEWDLVLTAPHTSVGSAAKITNTTTADVLECINV